MCSTSETLMNRFVLKGVDDALTLMKAVKMDTKKSDELPSSDSGFEDPPPFSITEH